MSTIPNSNVFNYESINGTMSYNSVIDSIVVELSERRFRAGRVLGAIREDVVNKISEWNKMRSMIFATNTGLYSNADRRLFSYAQIDAIRHSEGGVDGVSSTLAAMKLQDGIVFKIE
jgi:hypothetical protein